MDLQASELVKLRIKSSDFVNADVKGETKH